MKILFVATEAAPLAKVGGMGDVVGVLPKVLRQLGHDVRIFMPYYGFLPEKVAVPGKPVWSGSAMLQDFEVYETVLPGTGVPLYLFGHSAFAPKRVYLGDDEDWRFTFFANGAALFCWEYWQPQIVHCHDWHAGMTSVWLHQTPDIKTVFTIHNLAYQGPWRGYLEQITWCPDYMKSNNTMAGAIELSDRVNTVSPTYAKQIQTMEYGENLEDLLASVGDKIVGIVNGMDLDSYNPATDQHIAQTFTPATLEQRKVNKRKLQQEVGLPINSDVFVIGMVSRLVEQKGIDLVLEVLPHYLQCTDAQVVVLGTGEKKYEKGLAQMATLFPDSMSVKLKYNEGLGRRIYSGGDAFLMPSKFEPCGISQMMAMRYGCVPIVRHTGGLVDTVTDYNPNTRNGTGFCFDRYNSLELFAAMVRTRESFRDQDKWQQLQKRDMAQDFSWEKSAQEYIKMYEELVSETVTNNHKTPSMGIK
ncbi:MAG: glycogen synthase GlgA [Prochloron sp. SP5CPC1]|nr:glycogen synthase GlgA [Candidatus Paraprochloron terpiosi SP5CPC1]